MKASIPPVLRFKDFIEVYLAIRLETVKRQTPCGVMWKLWRGFNPARSLSFSIYKKHLTFFCDALFHTSFPVSHCQCHGIPWQMDYGQFSAGLSEINQMIFVNISNCVTIAGEAPKLELISTSLQYSTWSLLSQQAKATTYFWFHRKKETDIKQNSPQRTQIARKLPFFGHVFPPA